MKMKIRKENNKELSLLLMILTIIVIEERWCRPLIHIYYAYFKPIRGYGFNS